MNKSDWLDELDRAWDGVATGALVDDALDPETHRLLTGLHRLQASADAPLAGRRRAWSPPARAKRRVRLHAARFNAIHAYTLIGLLILASMAGAYSTTRHDNDLFNGATAIPAAGGPPLYRIDGSGGTWQKIDPITLANVGEPTQVLSNQPTPANERHWLGLVSADGSTLVEQIYFINPDNSSRITYRIYNAAAGTVRSEIEPEKGMTIFASSLSADGQRLAFYHTATSAISEPVEDPVDRLVIYDTTTGNLINSVALVTDHSDVLGYPVVDAAGTRAFVMNIDFSSKDWQAGAVALATYDLDSGSVINTTSIPGMTKLVFVIPGSAVKPEHVTAYRPVMNLSADGRTLAMITWDGQTLVRLDTRTTRVQSEALVTSSGSPCFALTAGFSTTATLSLTGNRLVTGVLGSSGGSEIDMIGYCSTDVRTGQSLFKSYREMLPQGWIAPIAMLSSDASHFYLDGYQANESLEQGTPEPNSFSYGIFEVDAATLAPGGHAIFKGQSPRGFPEGLLLTERMPS